MSDVWIRIRSLIQDDIPVADVLHGVGNPQRLLQTGCCRHRLPAGNESMVQRFHRIALQGAPHLQAHDASPGLL